MVIDQRVATSIRRINIAKDLADIAGEEYFAACERFDWIAAESARARMMGHIEAFTDQIAAVYRLLQAIDGR